MVVSALDARRLGLGIAIAAGLAVFAVGAGLMLAGWSRGAFSDKSVRCRRRRSRRPMTEGGISDSDNDDSAGGGGSPEKRAPPLSIFERCLPFADLRGVACRFPAACFSPVEAGDGCFHLRSLSADEDDSELLGPSLLARRRRRKRLVGCRRSLDVAIGRSVCELGDETLARVSSLESA
ncbi:ORF023 [Saltwater crocodilepox virus]|nr:ORF023 [Saltwater crocodilepox virus]QGT49033.1 ORF023 [Saltwater crocodilepox virus]